MEVEKISADLKRITESVYKENNETVSFSEFLYTLNTTPFSLTSWPASLRMQVCEFGLVFQNINAGPYIIEINKYLEKNPECEFACFINSEIIWNYFDQAGEYNRDLIKSYIKKFPHNPEFHNTYGLFLFENKSYDKAIFEHQRALNIDPKNINFLNCYIVAIKNYFEYLIEKRSIQSAENLIDETNKYINNKRINKIPITGNVIADRISSMKDRIRDHKTIDQQIGHYKREIENSIRTEQRKLIEILGIFSAIIAFILTNISIGLSNLSVKNMLILMIGMSIVLLIFSISISFLFGPKLHYPPKLDFMKRPKFLSILILILALFFLFYIS